MTDKAPDWRILRARLSEIAASDSNDRQAALDRLIEETILLFENCPPTPWEAHFLLHAIRHLRTGFPAVAIEELASMMKPRGQQGPVAPDLPLGRLAMRPATPAGIARRAQVGTGRAKPGVI